MPRRVFRASVLPSCVEFGMEGHLRKDRHASLFDPARPSTFRRVRLTCLVLGKLRRALSAYMWCVREFRIRKQRLLGYLHSLDEIERSTSVPLGRRLYH